MNLRLNLAILVIVAFPIFAQAQETSAAKSRSEKFLSLQNRM